MRSFLTVLLVAAPVLADGPQDNLPDKVRRIPPPGIQVDPEVRAALQKRTDELHKQIDELRSALKNKPAQLALLPDVEVFHKAVSDALKYDEIYTPQEPGVAAKLLERGFERAAQLREGKPAWTTQTGLVVRGYVSKIDGSVQPYGLVVPSSYKADYPHRYRLDFWCHGRGEKLTELAFVQQRLTSPGEFTPPNAFVLHLYGRYCCANKFAGEVDLFEAYDSVKSHYPIDENRLVIRGFSMGGAACWQFAVHYPGMWAAAAPGAGFSETPEFLRIFQDEKVQPTFYEKKLWHLYDCTDYASNLLHCPTVAYSGEIDRQKQAADIMARALMQTGGTPLTHIIGPKTGHSYHPQAKAEINRRIDAIVARGRDPVPARLRFATYTLRYPRCQWLTLDELQEHWQHSQVSAELAPDKVVATTANVTGFTIELPSGQPHLQPGRPVSLEIDRQRLEGPLVATDRSWTIHLRMVRGDWTVVATTDREPLVKKPGLQGPIDDAFWDRFVMVRPTGQPLNDKVGKWAEDERKHAVEHWRRQFRGIALQKDDRDVTDADIASSNLVLWGDPSSNSVLAKIADKLPIRWDAQGVRAGTSYSAATHVPLLICPNPLNPKKYVVLNSGITFREYDYLNNARQVPKLPDWAVIDVSVPASSRAPGKVVAAHFFDENWALKKP